MGGFWNFNVYLRYLQIEAVCEDTTLAIPENSVVKKTEGIPHFILPNQNYLMFQSLTLEMVG